MKKISNFFTNHLAFLIVTGIAILCLLLVILGKQTESGYITLNGQDAKIEEYTEKFIENANDALYRIMNEDAPTDDETIKANAEGEGLGGSTTLNNVISRRLPDGNTDDGRGWQCSKYTAYLATGRREYSSTHPDYGPVNGKNVAQWLHDNFGWKYIGTPVEGAIGSGGFNTQYGHTAMFLYWVSDGVAMVNDANYVPLTVATHPMNVDGWVWVVPGDYTPDPTPTPTPTPVSDCKTWNVVKGDTMGAIMKTCRGYVDWSDIDNYAMHWYSTYYRAEQSVYSGWNSGSGVGLYAGDIIYYKE